MIDKEVSRGDVGGHSGSPPVAVDSYLGEVVLLEGKLRKDDHFEIKCGAKRVKCQVKAIEKLMSSETGEVIATNPEVVGLNQAATVVFKTEPMVVERFLDMPSLGRFILARDGKNIGAGIVLEVGS